MQAEWMEDGKKASHKHARGTCRLRHACVRQITRLCVRARYTFEGMVLSISYVHVIVCSNEFCVSMLIVWLIAAHCTQSASYMYYTCVYCYGKCTAYIVHVRVPGYTSHQLEIIISDDVTLEHGMLNINFSCNDANIIHSVLDILTQN